MLEMEYEKTYLAKYLPEGLRDCDKKEVLDVYIPKSEKHPTLRIRKNGSKFEITKKEPVSEDCSEQEEHTIHLNETEFKALSKTEGNRVRKIRYLYPFKGRVAEIDIFLDGLEGLALVDFEFKTREEKQAFEMPDFCLADVTQDKFVAGGMLCGRSYKDIEEDLKAFNYQKLAID